MRLPNPSEVKRTYRFIGKDGRTKFEYVLSALRSEYRFEVYGYDTNTGRSVIETALKIYRYAGKKHRETIFELVENGNISEFINQFIMHEFAEYYTTPLYELQDQLE
jgi:hypothetical protein